jgi:ribA/ribD-fused uncharacterized protein
MERFTFFWYGPFSQWEPSRFSLDGVEYSCAEQFMMAEKARGFGDDEVLAQILKAEDPATHKRLGREVRGFSVDDWQEEQANGRPLCWNLVWRGNMAKFSQNEHLLQDLLATAGATLVEASPHDRIWGVGLAEDDPRIQSREGWLGRNWLGEVLTAARAQLVANPGVSFTSSSQLAPLLERV